MARNIYEEIGRSIRKTNEVDADIGTLGDETILPGGFNERIAIHINGVKQTAQEIDFPNSFILSSPLGAVLGINRYGVSEVSGIYDIYNSEDTYYETLTGSEFINIGSTTADIIIGSAIVIQDDDEYWTSPVFFSRSANCTAARLIMKTNDYNLDETKIYFRNDPSNNWKQFILDASNKYKYFNKEGKQLEMKLVAKNPIDQNHISLDSQQTLFHIQYLQEHVLYTFAETGDGLLFYDNIESISMNIVTNQVLGFMEFLTGISQYVSKELPLRYEYTSVELSIGSMTGLVNTYISNDNKQTWTALPLDTEVNLYFNPTDKAYIKFINDVPLDYNDSTFDVGSPTFSFIFGDTSGLGPGDTTIWRDSEGIQYKLIFRK